MNTERIILIALGILMIAGSGFYAITELSRTKAMLAEEQERVMVMSMICGMPPPVRVPQEQAPPRVGNNVGIEVLLAAGGKDDA